VSNELIKVNVCVVTYNQQDFIRQCLDSILSQQTDFVFNLLVADDCSTDRTPAILAEYQSRYPQQVILLQRSKNLGAYQNFKDVHQQASAPYVCHCDGDDYWLPGKLQVQADYLDRHPDCNVVFTRTLVEYAPDELVEDNITPDFVPEHGFRRADVLRMISIGTNSSKMYRRPARPYPYPDIPVLDYFETVEQTADGYATYVSNTCYSVYRAGIGIASQGLSTRYALHQNFRYFAKRFPHERAQVNTAALFLFLADLKNRRQSWKSGLATFIATFHPAVCLHAFKAVKQLKTLRNPERN
jgi:glycosyltransferase involved in cell wall biosynthesis